MCSSCTAFVWSQSKVISTCCCWPLQLKAEVSPLNGFVLKERKVIKPKREPDSESIITSFPPTQKVHTRVTSSAVVAPKSVKNKGRERICLYFVNADGWMDWQEQRWRGQILCENVSDNNKITEGRKRKPKVEVTLSMKKKKKKKFLIRKATTKRRRVKMERCEETTTKRGTHTHADSENCLISWRPK